MSVTGLVDKPEDTVELTHEETTQLLLKAWLGHEKLLDMLETAWGLIAEANSDISVESPGYKKAVAQWREKYCVILQNETLPNDGTRSLSTEEIWNLVKKEKDNDREIEERRVNFP